MTRKQILIAMLGSTVLGGTVLWVIQIRRPLSSHTDAALEQMIQGNAKALMSYVGERESREEGLTREKLQTVLDRLLVSQIAHKAVVPTEHEDDTGDFHALSMRDVITYDGRTVSLGFELYKAEDGLRTNVLGTVLRSAWELRYRPTEGYDHPSGMFLAGARGIETDRAFLESLGIRGVTSKKLDAFTTWPELIARNRDMATHM